MKVIRLGITTNEQQVVAVNVDQAQDANCNIPFVAEIRKSVKCSDNPCNPEPVAVSAAAISTYSIIAL